ncbi:hypothetical protein N876_16155 (plasmid) [Lactiplantibacillus plantarum 2025]|uniref:hypothetical protein n=1 Tax=Lactiplantibacillus plantarum TaxID=1590 RepID=UPI001C241855|nr:hypothetical protein [Lactiplantibacillus plantarum]QXD13611.1 hypothetical protein N876_16155 [Lactiplantibacillus plantarum 2025]
MTKPSKEVEKIEQLLADPWAINIQKIWEQAEHNQDPEKLFEVSIDEQAGSL